MSKEDKELLQGLQIKETLLIKEVADHYKNYQDSRERLKYIQYAIQGMGGKPGAGATIAAETPEEDKYDPEVSWDNKVLFVLKQVKEALPGDIVTEIRGHEPKLDLEKTKKGVGLAVSRLYTNKKVKREKLKGGNKYKYFL